MSQLAVSFKIELSCESLQSTEVVSVSFPDFPSGFDKITAAVEDKYSIPSYSQTIWVHGNRIEPHPSNTPASAYLQSGDTIKITYLMKCDCKSVKECVEWMCKCLEIVQKLKISANCDEVRSVFEENKTALEDNGQIYTLIGDLFIPWSDSIKKMNAHYFDHLGGVDLLVKLHQEMSWLRNNNLFMAIHSFCEFQESYYCSAIGNFSSDTALRKRITACGGLERCLATFMAYQVDDSQHSHLVNSALLAICK